MNEDTKTYTTNTIPIPDIPVPMSNSPETHNMSLDSSGLDLDQSLLDNISNDDVISEDILYQVAKQLVSNTELQNAIDKGINDGVLDTSSIQDVMDISNASQSSNSSFSVSFLFYTVSVLYEVFIRKTSHPILLNKALKLFDLMVEWSFFRLLKGPQLGAEINGRRKLQNHHSSKFFKFF